MGKFFRRGQERLPGLRQAAGRNAAQGIGAMQPAGAIIGRHRQFRLRNFQRVSPALFPGAKGPARLQHGGMFLLDRRNQIQFGLRLGGTTQPQPPDSGVKVVRIGRTQSLHRHRKPAGQGVCQAVGNLAGNRYRNAMKKILSAAMAAACAVSVQGAIQTKTIEYKQGDTVLEGFVAWDDARPGVRPGVLVVHQWMGLTDYEKHRAEMLAQLGYVAFCADIYGKGVRPQNPQEAGALAGKYKAGDRQLLRARVNAGLDALRQQPLVDSGHIAAIGYCFGGTTVLELARSGAQLNGVVSFHGGLDAPNPDDGKNIKCKVLVLHGADDPFSSPQDIAALENEMRQGGVDWQLVKFGGAVHAFTQPMAGNDNSKGVAYNEKADKRSWEYMKLFFNEIFK